MDFEYSEEEYEITPTNYILNCLRCPFKINGSKSLIEAAIKEHNESRHGECGPMEEVKPNEVV